MKEKKLYRSCKDKVVGGVCGGLGEYFDVDPILIRLAVILFTFAGGAGVVFYIIAWIIIPQDPMCENAKEGAEEIKAHAQNIAKEIKKTVEERGSQHGDNRLLFGAIIVIIGALFLLQNLFNINLWSNFWPIVLIILGLYFMLKSNRR
ncbi:MAG: PspC domain-containing protein [bacterium]